MENKYYTDAFLKEEVKCEYRISKKQKKIWAVELDLFEKLLEVCDKHKIKVFAFGGTLLGAVRHGGFIPWDDDMDVCLLPEEFGKLTEVAEKEFRQPYFFQTARTDRRFHIGYARLRNSDTTGFIPYNDSVDYNNGIFIDIFVLNGYNNNKIELYLQLFQLRLIEKLIHSYYVDLKTKRGLKKAIMGVTKWIEHKMISYDQLISKYSKIQSLYDKKSDRVTILTSSNWFMERYWCNRTDLDEMVLLPFESLQIPAPKNFDSVLRNAYGNYMQLPPVSERGKWHENIIHFDPDTPYKEYVKRLHGESDESD